MGIDVLKKDTVIVCKVIGTTDKALSDGKVNLTEGIMIAKDAIGLISVARNWQNAKSEIKDLSNVEKIELLSYVAQEFDLRNDVAEKWVETALEVIVSLGAAFTAQQAA